MKGSWEEGEAPPVGAGSGGVAWVTPWWGCVLPGGLWGHGRVMGMMLNTSPVLPAGTPGHIERQDAALLPDGPRATNESLEGTRP